jgi:hypothetical protein
VGASLLEESNVLVERGGFDSISCNYASAVQLDVDRKGVCLCFDYRCCCRFKSTCRCIECSLLKGV